MTGARHFAGRGEWFEIEDGMVFEVLRAGPVGSRWKVVQTPYDGNGTARMERIDEGHTDERDTVWWTELFADCLLIEELPPNGDSGTNQTKEAA